jgi:hypothetical protein
MREQFVVLEVVSPCFGLLAFGLETVGVGGAVHGVLGGSRRLVATRASSE